MYLHFKVVMGKVGYGKSLVRSVMEKVSMAKVGYGKSLVWEKSLWETSVWEMDYGKSRCGKSRDGSHPRTLIASS